MADSLGFAQWCVEEIAGHEHAADQVMALALLKDALVGEGAIVLPERRGVKAPCTCCTLSTGKKICTTKGAIGTLTRPEITDLCSETRTAPDGRCARAEHIRGAAARCKESNPENVRGFFECFIPAFYEKARR